MKPVPVALVILDPGFGGGHTHVLDIASNVSKRFGPVVISSSRETIDKAKKMKLAIIALPASRFFGIEDVKPLRRLLAKHKFSLVHAHGPRAGWASVIATRGMGVKFVYTDHAWNPDYRIKATNAVMQMIGLRLVCYFAAKVIAVSSASREFLVGRGIAKPEKVIVIPNGIVMPTVYGRQTTADLKSPIVGSVGVFTTRKAFDVFVEAMPHVLAKNPKVRFAIVGDGPEKMNVEKLAIRLGVRRFIHLPGAVSDKERDAERKKWTVYVQSSRDESFGIAAAESLAMGIPVVGTNVGGLPDVINGGGIIVEKENSQALAEAILKLLGNSKLRGKLAQKGSAHVRKNFELKKVIRQIEEIYQSCVDSRII